MKKTYPKTIFRTIRSTLSRFLAIFAIVALGVGFLAGLLSSPGNMRYSADVYYDEAHFYDYRVVSTLGLTEEDLQAVEELEQVEAVMPVYDSDFVLISSAGDSYTARMHSLPEDPDGENPGYLNRLTLVEGRMPEKAGECVVLLTLTIGQRESWVGQTLTLDPGETDYQDKVENTFTVVGTVKGPSYVSMEPEYTTAGSGRLGLMAYTVPESFSMDYYTAFYLSAKGARALNAFDSAYEAAIEELTELLEPLGENRSQLRYEEIIGDAEEQLQEAKEEYETEKAKAEKELEDARLELEDGKKELEKGQKELEDAKVQLEDGRAELEENRDAFYSQISSARQQINDGYAQIGAYQTQLNAGLQQIKEAQAKIDEGLAQLQQGEAQLEAAKAQLDEQEANLSGLEAGKEGLWQTAAQLGIPVSDTSDAGALALIAQLELAAPEAGEAFAPLKAGLEALAAQGTDTASSRAALEAGKAEYQQNLAAAQASREELSKNQQALDAQSASLRQQQATLTAQRAELDQSQATLQETINSTTAQLNAAEEELAQGQAEYEDGMSELEKAKKDLEEGQREYDKGRAEAEEKLADAEEQLKDAEAEIRDIETGKWYLFTRDDNVSFSTYDSNADKIAAIAAVFPLFFFLVAALVALTTMTRMVEEERQQVGTLKALGYSSGKIAAKYLIYAALASVLGSIFGLAVGSNLFPAIIISAYNIMYDYPYVLTPFNPVYALVSSLAAIACTLAATLSACWAELKIAPARLLLPKAPKAGKRIFLEYVTPLWSRMKFTSKVTARNLFRYKKRFFMTIIGIAGCTALLLTGFGVRDSISDIVALQYGELNQYQLIISLKDASALQGRELQSILGDKNRVAESLSVLQDNGKIVPEKGAPEDNLVIFVPEDTQRLPDYFQFRHRRNNDPVAFEEDSVIITEKLSERHNLKVGDTITVRNKDEKEASFTITDICENYVSHYLYLPKKTYQEAFSEEASPNTLLCKLPENGTEEESHLTTALLKCRDVAGAGFTTELSKSFSNTIKNINYIVIVLIISAGALAFVVLYNLTNINITEREKEIATIKVLGFYDKEVSAYVYRETILLTLFGTIAGLGLGVLLHQFVIRTAEIDMVMFGRSVYGLSYLWSALLTLLFSLIVNLVMHRKLKGISMVESMKAPE